MTDANCTDDGYTLDCSAGLVTRNLGSGGTYNTELKVPAGTVPTNGWPVVVMFQGTGNPTPWSATTDQYTSDEYGKRYQVELMQNLLADGYAILTFDAYNGTYYSTNSTAPYGDSNWLSWGEHGVVLDLLDDMASGAYGHSLDMGSLYAAGISSGGFMTSRFQRHYDGLSVAGGQTVDIKAVANQSGGWASCSNPCGYSGGPGYGLNTMPGGGWFGYGNSEHADTVPTLFLVGDGDSIVPSYISGMYHNMIEDVRGSAYVSWVEEGTTNCPHGLPDGKCGKHQWIEAATTEIPTWFNNHP